MSECLFQQIVHLCRCLFLYLVRGVGVGGEGESGAAVSQHTGYGFYIDSVLQGEGREGVPQVVEADVFQPGIGLAATFDHHILFVSSAGIMRRLDLSKGFAWVFSWRRN